MIFNKILKFFLCFSRSRVWLKNSWFCHVKSRRFKKWEWICSHLQLKVKEFKNHYFGLGVKTRFDLGKTYFGSNTDTEIRPRFWFLNLKPGFRLRTNFKSWMQIFIQKTFKGQNCTLQYIQCFICHSKREGNFCALDLNFPTFWWWWEQMHSVFLNLLDFMNI